MSKVSTAISCISLKTIIYPQVPKLLMQNQSLLLSGAVAVIIIVGMVVLINSHPLIANAVSQEPFAAKQSPCAQIKGFCQDLKSNQVCPSMVVAGVLGVGALYTDVSFPPFSQPLSISLRPFFGMEDIFDFEEVTILAIDEGRHSRRILSIRRRLIC